MQKTMCGLVKQEAGPGDFVYRTDLPVPEIGDDEVLIKVRYVVPETGPPSHDPGPRNSRRYRRCRQKRN